jgi:hypothetical protein
MKDWGPVWDWGYIRPGQNNRDLLLSVRFAKKANLPNWMYMVGAEYDMLANEQSRRFSTLLGWIS